ncbi:predicted protein [Arabidopsis lyrata subsp. lyrata]|uniref:Predicted protein n=1 Tax=Arabidopsis lyrata subsp. lyrata TaxID=81972 RepID=D7LB26_ARALL|nr:predicted protein [Arabidopsis lyrata subsp. lyrata]
MVQAPRTRSGTKRLREQFNKSIESLITLIEQEELEGRSFTKDIIRETPIEPHINPNVSKAQDLENEQDNNYFEHGTSQETEIIKDKACVQLKTQTASFLPILQGIKEPALFIISKIIQ